MGICKRDEEGELLSSSNGGIHDFAERCTCCISDDGGSS